MALREQMILTTRRWIQAHNDWNVTGEGGVKSLVAPNFVARTFPSSLQHPGRNPEEYITYTLMAFTLFDTYHATETDLVVDEAGRKVVYYIDVKGTASVGEYTGEYVHKLALTEDGKSIEKCDAFIGSEAYLAFMKRVEEAQAAQGAREEGE